MLLSLVDPLCHLNFKSLCLQLHLSLQMNEPLVKLKKGAPCSTSFREISFIGCEIPHKFYFITLRLSSLYFDLVHLSLFSCQLLSHLLHSGPQVYVLHIDFLKYLLIRNLRR